MKDLRIIIANDLIPPSTTTAPIFPGFVRVLHNAHTRLFAAASCNRESGTEDATISGAPASDN